jgi:hypothetical protein
MLHMAIKGLLHPVQVDRPAYTVAVMAAYRSSPITPINFQSTCIVCMQDLHTFNQSINSLSCHNKGR